MAKRQAVRICLIKISGSGIKLQSIYKMPSVQNSKIPPLDSSLDFQKEFTYINIIQEELSKDKKPSRLKIHSKISAPLTLKNQTSHQKVGTRNCSSKSEIRKKSRTVEKQQNKKKYSSKKSLSKNYQNNNKRICKTVENKPKDPKLQSNRSLKSANPNKPTKEDQNKIQDQSRRKKKTKVQPYPKMEKTSKSLKQQSGHKVKMNKTKSSTEFESIPLSSIKPKVRRGPKQSKIIHEYFGMEDKLSSIVEEKDKKHKRNHSKLSKCKTQSSSSSISLKAGLRFGPKGIKARK